MLKFCLKRLAFLPLVMFGVTFLLFFCLQFLSPEMRASLYIKDPRQLSQLDAVIEKYGLRKPMPVQYGIWLKDIVVHGMLGASFISTVIGTKLPGPGALWVSQTLDFLLPVRLGARCSRSTSGTGCLNSRRALSTSTARPYCRVTAR